MMPLPTITMTILKQMLWTILTIRIFFATWTLLVTFLTILVSILTILMTIRTIMMTILGTFLTFLISILPVQTTKIGLVLIRNIELLSD